MKNSYAICIAAVLMTIVICITHGCVETTRIDKDYDRGWRSDRQAIENLAVKIRELDGEFLKLKSSTVNQEQDNEPR